MIELDNVSVSFAQEQVLSGLSVYIKRGDKVALVGPSGCGKSTVLNLIMGFVRPANGAVRINGIAMSEQTIGAIRQQISWLPQELSLKVDSVRELFYYPFTFKINRAKHPSDAEVARIFGELGLDIGLLDKSLLEISGGQKQRVVLASVLLLKKGILLLDEPTSALDVDSKNAIVALVKRLEGVTVVAATHDREWIGAMDQVVELNRM